MCMCVAMDFPFVRLCLHGSIRNLNRFVFLLVIQKARANTRNKRLLKKNPANFETLSPTPTTPTPEQFNDW